MCNKSLIEAFLVKLYSTLRCSVSDFQSFFIPPPAFTCTVSMHSIIIAMGFGGQKKLACAIRG